MTHTYTKMTLGFSGSQLCQTTMDSSAQATYDYTPEPPVFLIYLPKYAFFSALFSYGPIFPLKPDDAHCKCVSQLRAKYG